MDIGIERVTKKKKRLPRIVRSVFLFFIILIIFFLIIAGIVHWSYYDRIVTADKIEQPNIGLVFGAGLKAQGKPGAVLEDRILTAIELYQSDKIGKLIMSGDNSSANHNEVQAMRQFAEDQGLPGEAILFDDSGLSTYDSCFRVREIFGLNKIVLITQKYHLPRALYICNKLGINAFGVSAKNRGYAKQVKYSLREIPASINAWLEINITKPKPNINKNEININ